MTILVDFQPGESMSVGYIDTSVESQGEEPTIWVTWLQSVPLLEAAAEKPVLQTSRVAPLSLQPFFFLLLQTLNAPGCVRVQKKPSRTT